MYIVANWHKHKSATLFWVAAGYVRAYGEDHARDITSQLVFLFHVCQYGGTFIHSYVEIITNSP